METMTYWWLKVSTWYYTNVGSDYHGYQVFNWWIVDGPHTRSTPVGA